MTISFVSLDIWNRAECMEHGSIRIDKEGLRNMRRVVVDIKILKISM